MRPKLVDLKMTSSAYTEKQSKVRVITIHLLKFMVLEMPFQKVWGKAFANFKRRLLIFENKRSKSSKPDLFGGRSPAVMRSHVEERNFRLL